MGLDRFHTIRQLLLEKVEEQKRKNEMRKESRLGETRNS